MALPPPRPVTTPPLVTEATKGELDVQLPPTAGYSVVVVPSQMVLAPEMEAIGFVFTVTTAEGGETQLVDV